jgi:hypothetical protein
MKKIYCHIKLYAPVIFFILLISACKKGANILKKRSPEVILNNTRILEDKIYLDRDTVYVLSNSIVRNDNQILTIEAGTVIKIEKNIGITINPKGKIISDGTFDNPIVFTYNGNKGTQGLGNENWNGIVINGAPNVNSGLLSFSRIEFAGSSNFPSLLLNNVDSVTDINNVQISYAHFAKSIEFNGGNCNASNLISFAAAKTDFSFTNGYKGKVKNLLAYRHIYFPLPNTAAGTLAGIYINGSNTFPSISNCSVVGPDGQYGSSIEYDYPFGGSASAKSASVIVSNGAKFHIRNSVLSGFPKGGFYIDSKESAISLQTGESDFMYNFVHANDSSRAFYIPTGLVPGITPPVNAASFKSYLLQPQFYNQFVLNTAVYKFTSPYDYDYNPNPMPQAGSPVLTGANFSAPFNNAFFKTVTYRGALGADNWMSGWVNFKPLQTDYNN